MREGVVGIIAGENGKLLLLHRALHWKGWEFPKGGVEAGESEEKALLREIEEETGLKAEIATKLPYEISYVSGNEDVRQKVFLSRCKEVGIRLSEEHDKFLWVGFEKAVKL